MKVYQYLAIILLSGIVFSCAHGSGTTDNYKYTSPTVKYQPRLVYPKIAQENSITGESKFILLISKTGKVEKVDLIESSGFDLLDNAAVEYCKALQFNPAKINGVPIYSRMEWAIWFNISDQDWDPHLYVQDISKLYSRVAGATTSLRTELENEILDKHIEFVQNMGDALNFNYFVEKVILPEISDNWKTDWDEYPLSFLIYHDFLKRFKDYKNVENVRMHLANSLKYDLNFINSTDETGYEEQKKKDHLLQKIRDFINEYYPDLAYIVLESDKVAVPAI